MVTVYFSDWDIEVFDFGGLFFSFFSSFKNKCSSLFHFNLSLNILKSIWPFSREQMKSNQFFLMIYKVLFEIFFGCNSPSVPRNFFTAPFELSIPKSQIYFSLLLPMKEQLEFWDVLWELRHCCNCYSCYWSLFMAKTFLKMIFLLKMMLLRKLSALENVASYCHAASQSIEEDLMQYSQGGSGRDGHSTICPPQEASGTPKKALCSVGIAAGWEKMSCACRHCLWPHQLLLTSVVTTQLPTHRRKPGHPGASPLCPRLLTQNLIHQLLGQGYGEGLQSEWAHKRGFCAHRASLLGITVTI